MPSDPYAYHRRLPHWRSEGAVYFVTWRLHPVQAALSGGERGLVVDAIEHFDGDRYELIAYVVMDDNVHVMMRLGDGRLLNDVIHSWKSFTAHHLVQLSGRFSPVWQEEYWDRVVRDESEFAEKVAYVVNNPAKRWPDREPYPWVWACCLGE